VGLCYSDDVASMVKFMLLPRPRCFSDNLHPDLCFSRFWMFDYSLSEDCVVVTKTVPLPVALFKGWICVFGLV
jgi:hypothetical protein